MPYIIGLIESDAIIACQLNGVITGITCLESLSNFGETVLSAIGILFGKGMIKDKISNNE